MDLSSILTRPEIIWFLIGLAFLIAEFMIPGLIIIFFGIGAWLTSLVCLFFDIGLNFQLLIFIGTSIIMLIFLRKYLHKVFYKKEQQGSDDLEDEFIGKTATVDTEIRPNHPGKVSFKGTQWNAKADEKIQAGQVVKIIGKESILLEVKSQEQSEAEQS